MGNKFGKSEGNALWLDKEKTSPYQIYQYLINSDDTKVEEYLKVFTFLSLEEIDNIMKEQKEAPEKRIAQKALAFEVVKDIHGIEEAEAAKKKSEEIFSNRGMSDETESKEIEYTEELKLVDFLMLTEMFPSKSEARRMVEQNAISINNEKVNNPDLLITRDMFKDNAVLVQKGKKNFKKMVLK